MQNKIQKLLDMTNASIELMENMSGTFNDVYTHAIPIGSDYNTGCVKEIVQTTNEEKHRVLKDLKE